MTERPTLEPADLAAATGYPVVTRRLKTIGARPLTAVMAALCERHVRALSPWLGPDERAVCEHGIALLWDVAGGARLDRPAFEAALSQVDSAGDRRYATDEDEGHPVLRVTIAVSSALHGLLDSTKTHSLFDAWESNVRLPAWGAWVARFAGSESDQVLVPIGAVVDDFPVFAAGHPAVRTELQYLLCLVDNVAALEATVVLTRERVAGACDVTAPAWQDYYREKGYATRGG